MFFVRKENIGTTLGTQKEYAAAARRGIQFQSDPLPNIEGHAVWHYLWTREQIEPSLRSDEHASHFIWSQEVAPGELIGDPLITPFNLETGHDLEGDPEGEAEGTNASVSDWLIVARNAWNTAMTHQQS